MATLEQEFVTRLLADSNISGLIANRLYPVRAEQDCQLPYIVYARLSGPDRALYYALKDGTEGLYSFDVYDDNYTDALTLANYIIDSLNYLSSTLGTREIVIIHNVNRTDLFEDDTKIYRISLDFMAEADR